MIDRAEVERRMACKSKGLHPNAVSFKTAVDVALALLEEERLSGIVAGLEKAVAIYDDVQTGGDFHSRVRWEMERLCEAIDRCAPQTEEK